MNRRTAAASLSALAAADCRRQRASLTFRGNALQGRHEWLRLTPAYSLHVVNELLNSVAEGEIVLDPFSGTATTTLASTLRGIEAHSVDINPFLVWLGNLKVAHFDSSTPTALRSVGRRLADEVRQTADARAPWIPRLHQIEKWWASPTLEALGALFAAVQSGSEQTEVVDLLKVAFCRAMIATSNASFGHQSMSFKKDRRSDKSQPLLFDDLEDRCPRARVADLFAAAVERIADSLDRDVPQAPARVVLGDARRLDELLQPATYSVVITSPPYPNRMSYIRELRPYMYWLGFLESGRQAGELDWNAIGGTWGCATSNLSGWQPAHGSVGHGKFAEIVAAITARHELLGKYVHRYFDDMKVHIQSLRRVLTPGAKCFYVVGNSKFYDTLLPVEEIYAALFEDAGFSGVGWKAIRKRNSKKELFEYVVYAENSLRSPSLRSRKRPG